MSEKPAGRFDKLEKIVVLALSVVVGGVAGFFAAILTVKNDIHAVDIKVAELSNEAKTVFRVKATQVDNMQKEIEILTRNVLSLQDDAELARLMRRRLDAFSDEIRRRTVGELREMLDKDH